MENRKSLVIRITYFGIFLLLLYHSFCFGSYSAALNKSGFINMERLSQIEQSIYVAETLNGNDKNKMRNVMAQTIELELFNIVDSQNQMKNFSYKEFLISPLHYFDDIQVVKVEKIEHIKERLNQIKLLIGGNNN